MNKQIKEGLLKSEEENYQFRVSNKILLKQLDDKWATEETKDSSDK